MTGLSRVNGRAVDSGSDAYEVAAVTDVLTTPIGSCCMARAYGSWLPELIDQPRNELNRLQILGATALALLRWRRNSRLKHVRLVGDGPTARLHLELVRTDRPRPSSLSISLQTAAFGRA